MKWKRWIHPILQWTIKRRKKRKRKVVFELFFNWKTTLNLCDYTNCLQSEEIQVSVRIVGEEQTGLCFELLIVSLSSAKMVKLNFQLPLVLTCAGIWKTNHISLKLYFHCLHNFDFKHGTRKIALVYLNSLIWTLFAILESVAPCSGTFESVWHYSPSVELRAGPRRSKVVSEFAAEESGILCRPSSWISSEERWYLSILIKLFNSRVALSIWVLSHRYIKVYLAVPRGITPTHWCQLNRTYFLPYFDEIYVNRFWLV